MLAPNSRLRIAAIALAAATTPPPAANHQPAAKPAQRRAARYAWARLLGRIYEVFPSCARSAALQIRVIAFITDPPTIHDILIHLASRRHHPRSRPPAASRYAICPMPGRAASTPQPAFSAKTADRGSKKVSPMVLRTSACQPGGVMLQEHNVCNVFLNECLALLL